MGRGSGRWVGRRGPPSPQRSTLPSRRAPRPPDDGETRPPQGVGWGAAGFTVYMPQPLALLPVAGPGAHGLPATGLVLTTRRFPFSGSLTFPRDFCSRQVL